MVLTKAEKKLVVKELVDKFKSSSATVFVNFEKLDMATLSQLREKLREQSIALKVYKNTLLARALRQALDESVALEADILNKPILVATSTKDEVTPFKALEEFAKNTDAIRLRAGIFEHQLISESEAREIANMPSKQELEGQFVGLLASLASRLTRALNFPVFALTSVVNQRKQNQS